jgi:hypothetical protein
MHQIQNSRPKDSNYPTATAAEYSDGVYLRVSVGDYIVDRDGDIIVATTSNRGEWPNEFLKSLNEPYFRAKFVGNPDDFLAYANQCRAATPEEAARAQQYASGQPQATSTGQLLLL